MTQRPNNFTLNINHPLAKGLVFAGLGAHAGSTLYHDSSVYGARGTLGNMEPATDWVPWSDRLALDLDGVNEYVAVAGGLQNVEVMTFGCWLASDSTNGGIYSTHSAATYPFGVRYSATPRVELYNTTDGKRWYSDTSILGTSTWNSLIAVRRTGTSTTTMSLWLNGVQLSLTYSASGGTGYFDASGRDMVAYIFDGRIADPCLWNRELSSVEIGMYSLSKDSMYGGLINPPRRKWWPVVSGAAPTFKAAWATKRRQTIGGGVI